MPNRDTATNKYDVRIALIQHGSRVLIAVVGLIVATLFKSFIGLPP